MRLLPGWLAGQPGGSWTLDGDESIRRRPVDRIAEPLRADGRADRRARGPLRRRSRSRARRCGRSSTRCPSPPRRSSRACCSPGCSPPARPTVIEPEPSRDHTERLLLRCGVDRHAARAAGSASARRTSSSCATCTSPATPRRPPSTSPPPCSCPGSRIVIEGMAANWTRVGFLRILERMGGGARRRARAAAARRSRPTSRSPSSTSPTARWSAPTVEAAEVPLAIDELPLVALLGCFAEGETVVRGAEELRAQGDRPDRHRRRRPARPRRRDRGHGRRLRRPGHRRAARRHDRLPRRPPPRDARRRRRPRLARGRRGRRHGGRRGLLPGLRGATWPRCVRPARVAASPSSVQ